MPFVHRPLACPFPIRPIDTQADRGGNWYLLGQKGDLLVLSPEGDPLRRLALDLSGMNTESRLVLRIGPGGGFGVIAEEYGTQGRVFNLAQGDVTLRLERGDYQVEHCAFPVAFVSDTGQDLLVHGTDWNRLDITDPASGEFLTPRLSPEAQREGPDPEHYLDYFHGRLHPSPGGEWIAEYGWIWHPWGQARVWSFPRWRRENVWESEDGPSLRDDLAGHPYFWDGPMAWIDGRHLAVWGLHPKEDLDEEIRPGIRIFDAVTGEETFTFPGPSVTPRPFIPGYGTITGWVACDRFLYAVSPEAEVVSVWNAQSGECLHREPGFAPMAHHRESQTFLSWTDGRLILSHFDEGLTLE